MRDSHDLWHVAAGYETDILGELAVLALTVSQTGNRALLAIVAGGYALTYRVRDPRAASGRQLIREAFRRGRRAAWLPAVDWEALLARDLTEVRAELRLTDTPRYQTIYSDDPALRVGRRAQAASLVAA